MRRVSCHASQFLDSGGSYYCISRWHATVQPQSWLKRSPVENHGKMVVLWENHRTTMGKWWFYPLVICYITDGKDPPFFMGKIHYFYGHVQYLCWHKNLGLRCLKTMILQPSNTRPGCRIVVVHSLRRFQPAQPNKKRSAYLYINSIYICNITVEILRPLYLHCIY